MAIRNEEGVVLRLSRRFDAPRERVFDAWTNPELLRRWWAAQPHWEGAEADIDLRPGGSYRLAMRDTDSGMVHAVVGEYAEVRPPERLAYTWTWESNPAEMAGSAGSLVEVDFVESDGGTEVQVTHSGFASQEIAGMHEHGWNGCLDNLERRVLSD
ncbi:MAG TPA: SRPBCC domain-containing protein [Gaiellaceae bacterium]